MPKEKLGAVYKYFEHVEGSEKALCLQDKCGEPIIVRIRIEIQYFSERKLKLSQF